MRASSPFRHRRLILQGAASLGLISGWSAKAAPATVGGAGAGAGTTTAPSTPSSATAVPKQTLYYKMQKYGLTSDVYK